MSEPTKFTDKAAELANKAVAAAAPLVAQAREKAGPLAAQAREKAAPLAAQALEKAGPLAAEAKEKAAELADKAGGVAAHGMDTLAKQLDKATGGKYSDKITSVTSKLGDRLDPDKTTDKPTDTGPGHGTSDPDLT
jgi:hypothetical protein